MQILPVCLSVALWMLLANTAQGVPVADSAKVLDMSPSVTAQVYDLEGKALHFTYARYGNLELGDTELKSEFFDLKKKRVVLESTVFKDGKLVSYTLDHLQKKAKGTISVKGDRVFFELLKKDGTLKKDDESLKKNFVVGSTLLPYLKRHFKTLLDGDEIKVRYGVWSRLETVGFKFWMDKERSKKNPQEIVIVMKPTSFLIRALVDPLYFTFDRETRFLKELKGRTTPNVKSGDDWKEFDAWIKYEKVR